MFVFYETFCMLSIEAYRSWVSCGGLTRTPLLFII